MQVDGVAFLIWVIISEFHAGCILKDRRLCLTREQVVNL
jgi:hypothetical protein